MMKMVTILKIKIIIAIFVVLIIYACSKNGKQKFEEAEKYLRAEKYVEAILDYNEVLKSNDEDLKAEALFKVALIHYINLKNYDKALKIFEQYLKRFPKNERADEVLKLMGDIEYKNFQDYNSAIIKYKQLIDNYPYSKFKTEAYFNMGKNYYLLNNYSQAIVEYKNLIKEFPNTDLRPEIELEIAQNYYFLGKQEDSMNLYISIIKNYVNKPTVVIMAKYYLASIYEETEQLGKALELYKTIQFTYPNPAILNLKIDRLNYRRSIQGRE